MRLSIFDDDATLGLAADMRGVKLRASGSINILPALGTAGGPGAGVARNIKNHLQALGWNIADVSQLTTLIYPYQTQTFHIYANVFSNFSDNEIVNNLARDLEYILSDVRVSIVETNQINYSAGSGAADNPAAGSNVGMYLVLGGGALVLLLLLRR